MVACACDHTICEVLPGGLPSKLAWATWQFKASQLEHHNKTLPSMGKVLAWVLKANYKLNILKD